MGVARPPHIPGRTIFLEFEKLLSVTYIVSVLLCPPRSKVLRPRHSTLGKHFLLPQVKSLPQQHSLLLEWVSYGNCLYPLAYEGVRNIQRARFQKKLVLELLEALSPFNTGGITRGRPWKLEFKRPLPPSCDSLASPLYMLTVGPTPAGTSGFLPMSSADLVGSDAALLLLTGTSVAAAALTAVAP